MFLNYLMYANFAVYLSCMPTSLLNHETNLCIFILDHVWCCCLISPFFSPLMSKVHSEINYRGWPGEIIIIRLLANRGLLLINAREGKRQRERERMCDRLIFWHRLFLHTAQNRGRIQEKINHEMAGWLASWFVWYENEISPQVLIFEVGLFESNYDNTKYTTETETTFKCVFA